MQELVAINEKLADNSRELNLCINKLSAEIKIMNEFQALNSHSELRDYYKKYGQDLLILEERLKGLDINLTLYPLDIVESKQTQKSKALIENTNHRFVEFLIIYNYAILLLSDQSSLQGDERLFFDEFFTEMKSYLEKCIEKYVAEATKIKRKTRSLKDKISSNNVKFNADVKAKKAAQMELAKADDFNDFIKEFKLGASSNLVDGSNHFAGSDSCSWYEFANLINQVAFNEGLVEKDDLIKPIESSSYKGNIALRPKYSILNSNKAYNYFSLTPTKLQNAILKSILSIENDER